MTRAKVGRLLLVAAGVGMLMVGCSTTGPRGESSSEQASSSSSTAVEWTDREEWWLEGETREDFQALMRHLLRRGGVDSEKASALEERLDGWPDRNRVAPLEWSRKLMEGKEGAYRGLLEHARVLNMESQGFDAEELEAVLGSDWFARLLRKGSIRSLDLRNNCLGPAKVKVLAASESIAALRRLDVRNNEIGDESVKALADSEHLAGLTGLVLEQNGIGPEGAKALAGSEGPVSGLSRLNLVRNSIGDEGTEALATSKHLSSLTHLYLGANEIGDRGAAALANSKHLHNLTYLDLRRNTIGDAGAKALAGSEHLAGLAGLFVLRNEIGSDGRRALENSRYLSDYAVDRSCD